VGARRHLAARSGLARDDSFALVNGPALARKGGQADLAGNLLRAFAEGGTAGVSARLCGTYNFVGADPRRGLRAFGDCSALYPLYYWSEGADAAVVSNRSSTVASVAGTSGTDAHALGWVIGRANLFGEDMPARGVRHVPGGCEARAAWGGSRLALARSPEWIWPEPSDGAGRDSLTDAEWDEITDELVSDTRLLGQLDVPIRLALTGGKDSRLSLALAKAAGLQDQVVAYTSGGRRSPEIEHAVAAANAAGVRHKSAQGSADRSARPPNAPRSPGERPGPAVDPDAEWRRIQRQVYRYEGIVGSWTDRAGWAPPDAVTIEGFVGELYRNGHEPRFRKPHPVTVDAYLSMFPLYHQGERRAGVRLLTSAEEEFQSDWIRDWVRTTARDVRLDLLPTKFYVDNRLAHWTGPLVQNASFVTVNPIASAVAARTALALSSEALGRDSVHLEVMRRTAPELLDLPLFFDDWGVSTPARPAGRQSAPKPSSAPPRPTPSPGTRALTKHRPVWALLGCEGEAIARLFEHADRHADLGSICDVGEAVSLARRSAELGDATARELLSCVGVAISLLDLAEPAVDPSDRSDGAEATLDRRAFRVATGKDRDGDEPHPTPAPSVSRARTGPGILERRLAGTWREARRHLPPRLVGTIEVPTRSVLRRLGVISRRSRGPDRPSP
jgi:hypothetical protein